MRAKSSHDRSTREQGRVLFVTDHPFIAAFKSELELAGFKVVGVAGGSAALVALRRSRPHVVLIDTMLKGISAEELARMISEHSERVPVIFVGQHDANTDNRLAAVLAGAFDYLQLPGDISLLKARAAQLVALSLQIERLRAEADRDYLTGLANRRRFRSALGKEVERWRRYQIPCGLLLVDIDHLKKINDKHGHPAGDVVIRHIAGALIELSRDNDTAARLGGEEFALLLAGADERRASAAAERLRQHVSAQPVEDFGIVTVSIGIATCPLHATSERVLYAAGDRALYRAKREGRNRSVLALPLTADPQGLELINE